MSLEIVTDSTVDLPAQVTNSLGISIIPMVINLGEHSYKDRVTLTIDSFFERLRDKKLPLPTTAAAALGDCIEIYNNHEGGLLSIHLGSSYSAMCATAKLASEYVKNKVHIYDSGVVSLGMGFKVMKAAEWAKENLPVGKIVEKLDDMKKRTRILISLDTLDYAEKGGRVSHTIASIGRLLNIKPILEIYNNQTIKIREKVLTRQRSLNRIVEIVKNYAPLEAVGVMHSGAEKEACSVADQIGGFFKGEIMVSEIGPAVCVHSGPGAVAVALVQQKQSG